jgi:hypothetical protein
MAEFFIKLTNQKVVTSILQTQGPFLDVKFQKQRETEQRVTFTYLMGKKKTRSFKKRVKKLFNRFFISIYQKGVAMASSSKDWKEFANHFPSQGL